MTYIHSKSTSTDIAQHIRDTNPNRAATVGHAGGRIIIEIGPDEAFALAVALNAKCCHASRSASTDATRQRLVRGLLHATTMIRKGKRS